MADANLTSEVPGPSGGGEAAVNRLSQVLETLVSKLSGGSSGNGGSGGRPKKEPNEIAEEKRLKAQGVRYRLEEQIHKITYDSLRRLATYRGQTYRQMERDHFIEQAARKRLSDSRKKQAESLESLERKWLRKEQNDREKFNANKDKQATNKSEALIKLRQDLADKLISGGKVSLKDARRLERAGDTVGATGVRNRYRQDKSNAEQEQLAELERTWLQKEKKVREKYKLNQTKKLDATRETEREFATKMYGRMNRGRNVTEGNLERAQELGLRGLVGQITAQLKKQKDTSAQKRVEDFEIQQHNKQVDLDRRAKAKAEQEAKGSGPGKAGGSFFGGFGRNMVIGRLYAAANAAIAPLEAFGTGVGVHWIKAWKSLTDAAFNTGKALSYASGMGASAAKFENNVNAFSERMKKYSSIQEMGTDVGGRAGAGMLRGSAGLAAGTASAVGGALDNPLTGFTHIVDQIGNAVGMADPGTMNRYNMILRDLTATIGQGLAPVVQMITKLMKEFGDYLQPIVQDFMPEIKTIMKELFDAIKPLIPLFVVELKNTIKDITESLKQIGAGGELNSGKMVRRVAGVDESSFQYMNAGGAFVKGLMNPFGMFGSGEGGAGGGGGGNMGGGPLGGVAGIMNQMAGLRKGNIAGAAVAQNATIGSGADLARRASQEAYISSSSRGNIDNAQNLFQQAAQAAIQFFQNANKPGKAANGNAQPGIAAAQPAGAWLDIMAAALPGGPAAAKGIRFMGF